MCLRSDSRYSCYEPVLPTCCVKNAPDFPFFFSPFILCPQQHNVFYCCCKYFHSKSRSNRHQLSIRWSTVTTCALSHHNWITNIFQITKFYNLFYLCFGFDFCTNFLLFYYQLLKILFQFYLVFTQLSRHPWKKKSIMSYRKSDPCTSETHRSGIGLSCWHSTID